MIPAHNEAAAIVATLDALHAGDDPPLDEVVVVVNGTTDETARQARESDHRVTVIELATASKCAALRAGDAALVAGGAPFPRLYLDGDVRLGTGAVARLQAAVSTGGLLAAAPTPRYDVQGCGMVVRSHYRFMAALQAGSRAIAGTGAMMVSAAGRSRFGEWPDVVADDYFLDGQFSDDERARLPDVEVVIRLPRTLRSCVRRRARIHQGNQAVLADGLRRHGRRAYRPSTVSVIRSQPRLVLDLPAHVAVTVAAKALAAWQRRRGTAGGFYRDPSSRS